MQDDWELESVSCSYEGEGEEGDVSVPNNAITIVEGETVTCVFENVYDPNSTPENGGGVNRNMGGGDGDTDGSVLGAATESCEPLLSTFLGLNRENDMTEVTELQTFLNDHMGAGLPVSGFFGPMTDGAVKTFQLQYWEEVLQPWFNIPGSAILDQDDATGFVYKTTQRMVNNIFCPSLNLPMPELP